MRRTLIRLLALGAAAAMVTVVTEPAGAVDGPGAEFLQKVWRKPTTGYTGQTCVFDLSGLPDYTVVSSLTQCGVTITFDPTVDKRSVPGPVCCWGDPPKTEDSTPDALYLAAGDSSLSLTLDSPRAVIGVEATGNLYGPHALAATWRDAGGNKLGTQNRTITSPEARLLAAKTASPFTSKLRLRSDDTSGLLIAQIRVTAP